MKFLLSALLSVASARWGYGGQQMFHQPQPRNNFNSGYGARRAGMIGKRQGYLNGFDKYNGNNLNQGILNANRY